MPLLRIKLPGQNEATHDLMAEHITIGRLPDNTIQIADESVSAHQAELIAGEDHSRLHDLASSNLSFVNGMPTTDCDLREACVVACGSVECEFDLAGPAREPGPSAAQSEKSIAWLRGENDALRAKLADLQRRNDIQNSAGLVAAKMEITPLTAAKDAFNAIARERDDVRHRNAGLHRELQNLREERTAISQERDAALQARALLESDKTGLARQLDEVRKRSASKPKPPIRLPAFPPRVSDSGSVGNIAPPVLTSLTQALFTSLTDALQPIRSGLEKLTGNSTEQSALVHLATCAKRFREVTAALGEHPIHRLGRGLDALLHEFAARPQPPHSAQVRSLVQTADLIARLLEPANRDRTPSPAKLKILAVDDDRDLLEVLAASLAVAHLPATLCADSREALGLIEKSDFDLLILDVHIPGMDGPTLCSQIRETPRYWKTPILFLTVANTLDHRAQMSLCGGNDFLPKPFNAAELVLKAETWIWKSRFGLL